MNLQKLTLLSLLAATPIIASGQIIAFDSAANYASTAWTDGSNGGTGFLPWAISSNNDNITSFAGGFRGDSTDGAGDINSDGFSFALYANPGTAFINADRGFSSNLQTGQTFSASIALNFNNGNKGFVLFGGSQGEVFNFNVGFESGVASSSATLTPGAGVGYDYGGNDAVIDLSITMTSATTFDYSIERASEQGPQGVLFSGTVSDLTDAITGFRFYNSGTDSGIDQNNLYFNNLTVVPEPGTYAALLGLVGLAIVFLRRRRS